MAEQTIKLSRQYDHGSNPFDAVVLREPKLKDRRAIGELFDVQRGGVVIWNDEHLWQYVDRLLVEPRAPGAIGELDLADAMLLEEKVRSFFIEASSLFSKPTSSSSNSDGV